MSLSVITELPAESIYQTSSATNIFKDFSYVLSHEYHLLFKLKTF